MEPESQTKRRVSVAVWISLAASLAAMGAQVGFAAALSRVRLRVDANHIRTVYVMLHPYFVLLLALAALPVLVANRRSPRWVNSLVGALVTAGVLLSGCLLAKADSASLFSDSGWIWLFVALWLGLAAIVGAGKRARISRFLTYGLGIFVVLFFFLPVGFEDGIRPPVSRAKSDMRSTATALEAYRIDNEAYPPSTIDPNEQALFVANHPMPSFGRSTKGGMVSLTTPVAYLTCLPTDCWSVYVDRQSTFAYWAPKEGGWILLSPGPNCVYDIDFATLQKLYRPREPNPTDDLKLWTYDPTNGTLSPGDVWRVKE